MQVQAAILVGSAEVAFLVAEGLWRLEVLPMAAAVEGDHRLHKFVPVPFLHRHFSHRADLQLVGDEHAREALHTVPVSQALAVIVDREDPLKGEGEERGVEVPAGVQVEHRRLGLDPLLLIVVDEDIHPVPVVGLAELIPFVPDVLHWDTRLGKSAAEVFRHIDDRVCPRSPLIDRDRFPARVDRAVAWDSQEYLASNNLKGVAALHERLVLGSEKVVTADKIDALIPFSAGRFLVAFIDSGKDSLLVVACKLCVWVHLCSPFKVDKGRHAALGIRCQARPGGSKVR
mmetsp:Transcript_30445/g.86056  ORF Transcript_30445/g.86056 Transcript_30445/m.86056 type:complete len:287 (-) Transcript_30445:785-1645(-)